MLPHFERLRDVVDQLRVVGEEVHRVLDALDTDGHADVVEPAEEGVPQRAVIHGQHRVLENGFKLKDVSKNLNFFFVAFARELFFSFWS